MELNPKQFNAPAGTEVSPEEAEQNRIKYGIRIHSIEPFEDMSDGGGYHDNDLDPYGGRYVYTHQIATVPMPNGERKTVGRISFTTGDSEGGDEGVGNFRGIEVDPEYAHLGIHHILLRAANATVKAGWGLPGLKSGTGRTLHTYNDLSDRGVWSQSIMNSLSREDAICAGCGGEGCDDCDGGYETENSPPYEKKVFGWKVPKKIEPIPAEKLVSWKISDKSKELPTNWKGE